MTRKKKSRSLKRIHSVKTGNISKLKRAGTTDRQSTNLKAKNKPKSIYQKFLEENPDAIEKQSQPAAKKTTDAAEKATTKDSSNKSVKPENARDKRAEEKLVKDKPSKVSRESKQEREPDLLSQLDNKNFNDFY
jgi:hypothetical protein